MFLRLEGLVRAVVRSGGTHHTEPGFDQVSTLGEHEELAEERNGDELAIQLGRHTRHFRETLTVEQPEPVDQSQRKLSSRGHALAPAYSNDWPRLYLSGT